jgi:hypothetical protein
MRYSLGVAGVILTIVATMVAATAMICRRRLPSPKEP